MADPQRETLVRKMVAEGTSDDDIRATLKAYDAQQSAPIHGKVQSDNPAEMIQQPTTFMGGFTKSILDQMGVGDPNSPLSHAAQPQGVGDIASLLLPTAGAWALGSALEGASPVRYAKRVVPQLAQEIPGAGKAQRIYKILTQANPNAGGVLNKTVAPSNEQALADALSELRGSAPARGTLPPEPTLAPGYTPRGTPPPRLSGGKVLNPNIASVEAAAPAAPASQSSIPSLASLKPTIQEINPADMPRDWHAFEDATSRAAGDPVEKAQASRLHQEIMDANQRYRNSTVDERAAFKANPPSVQDLLVALLKGQK